MKVSSHTARICKSSNCRVCGKRHNTLLHIVKDEPAIKVVASSAPTTPLQSDTSSVAHTTIPDPASQVFLSTAMVNVQDYQGNKRICRILLDSGSQSNFITEDIVQRLGLPLKPVNISIVGVNHACSKVQKIVQVQVSSRHYDYKVIIDCLVLRRITERLPGVTVDRNRFKIPQHVSLADPEFYRSADINILLGAEQFWNVLCVGQIKESDEHPLLQKTFFGWTIGGKYPSNGAPQRAIHCNVSVSYPNLEQAIERFWQTEQILNKPIFTAEERECEEQFKKTYRRTEQGRFVV